MSLFSPEEEENVFNFLKKRNCCIRCCLRYIGVRTPESYNDPELSVKNLGYLQPDSGCEYIFKQHCVLCLGILQNETQKSILEKIENILDSANYDSKTFTCALTIPISIHLRERSMLIALSKELNLSSISLNSLEYKLYNVKQIWKWSFATALENATKKLMQTASPLLIEIIFSYLHEKEEYSQLFNYYNQTMKRIDGKYCQKRNANSETISRKSMETLMTKITNEQFENSFDVPPKQSEKCVDLQDILCTHNSIFIGGRYNKFSRSLSQTPWFVNGERKMESSVQDLLCAPIVKALKAQSIKFLSSGREDVDVRNIYDGRPFAIELLNPKVSNITDELLANLVTIINQTTSLVKITSHLKVLDRTDLQRLKEGENAKTKFYRALCIYRDPLKDPSVLDNLNKLKEIEIIQKTPIRVLHRRPLTPRIRIIHEIRSRWMEPKEIKSLFHDKDAVCIPNYFILDVKVQAGTYVKEFVHGDFGRTKPSVCDLLNAEVDIVALDVTGIALEWP
ncbi:tRNA pseudouridine synthase Pus10 isoform X2 [Prorops nasuta]|uniref:tRNA pseudouridine synthase Pus10 isoform X2 n=1 Tax=Prorops nasuta TaxID=863751 RepID=UPI0034CE8A27